MVMDDRRIGRRADARGEVRGDGAWGRASLGSRGDELAWFLLPQYRSIASDGTVKNRDAVLARAASSHRAAAPSARAPVRPIHAHRAEVTIVGDTAVIRWVSEAPARTPKVSSADILVYIHGRWHAIYSQHARLSGSI
jgi:hypothetical protein